MLGKSGKYLLFMSCWWVLVFLVIHLCQFPLLEYLSSYLTYLIVFVVTGIFSIVCGQVEVHTGWWGRAGFWRKYLVVNGLYILNVILILAVIGIFHDRRMLGFFNSDPEGSFLLEYPWMSPLYLLAGIILGVWKYFRGRHKPLVHP